VGAAFGTFIGMFVSINVVYPIYTQKVGGLDVKRWFREILSICPGLLLPGIVGTLVMIFADTTRISVFLTYAVLFSLIYAISMWHWGMNEEEKWIFLKPMSRIIVRITGR
jgi:hypothetical protein